MTMGRRVLVNTSSLAAASFWRIAVSFALQLLVARWLDAAALGVFALMLAWLQIAQIASEAGLPAWMVRECAGLPERRRGLWLLLLRIEVVLALAAGSALLLLAWLLPGILPPLEVVAITALSLPFYAVMSASLSLFEAAESLERVFAVDVATNTLLLVVSVGLLYAGYGVLALFAALVVCQLFSALYALALVWRARARLFVPPTTVSQATHPTWRAALRGSQHYFKIAMADVVQQRADLLLLGALASPAVTGLYAAAVSIVRVLIKLAQSYWRALFPTLSRLYSADEDAGAHLPAQGAYARLHALALRMALVATVGVAVVVAPLAGEVARALFGAEFAAAGATLAILIWSAPLYAWETGTVMRLLAERQPGHAVRVSLAHLALLALLLPLLAWRWGAEGAAAASVLAAVGGSVVGAWYLRVWNDETTVSVLLRFALCALAAATVAGIAVKVAGALGIGWFAADQAASAAAWLAAGVALIAYVLLLISLRLLSASDLQRLRRAASSE